MSEEAIYFTVTMTPIPGEEAAVEAALRQCVRRVHDELPAVFYALHQTLEQPRSFVMLERWPGQNAVDDYSSSAPLKELWGALEGRLSGEPVVVGLSSLPEGDPAKGTL